MRVDESQWIKIPNHHPAIVSDEIFGIVQNIFAEKAAQKKNRTPTKQKRYSKYLDSPIKGKIFCGCCGRVMTLIPTKNPAYHCTFTRSAQDAGCHHLRIPARELESFVKRATCKQLQGFMSINNTGDTGSLSVKTEQQTKRENLLAKLQDEKCAIYEKFLMREFSLDEYKSQRAGIHRQIDNMNHSYDLPGNETTAFVSSQNSKCELNEAADIYKANGLTKALVQMLTQKILVFPDNHDSKIEIVWK